MSDERATAIHEAAHAIAATSFGWSVREVALYRATAHQSASGCCALRDHVHEFESDAFRYVTYLLCGGAAERVATGRDSPRSTQDLADAHIAAAVALQQDREAPAVQAAVRDAQLFATALMANAAMWAAVERTARALIARRSLSGRAVQLLLKETP